MGRPAAIIGVGAGVRPADSAISLRGHGAAMPPSESTDAGIPAIALRGMVIFPGVIVPLGVGRPFSLNALLYAREHNEQLVLVAQRSAGVELPTAEDLFDVGVVCEIQADQAEQVDQVVTVLVHGLWRCRIKRLALTEPFLRAVVEPFPDDPEPEPTELRARVRELFGVLLAQKAEAGEGLVYAEPPTGVEAEWAAGMELSISIDDRQAILAERSPSARCERALALLGREQAVLVAAARLQEEQSGPMREQERQTYLQERKEQVQKALDEFSEGDRDVDELAELVSGAEMSTEARAQAEKQLRRLRSMPRSSPEFPVAMDYVEWLARLPWATSSAGPIDLAAAQQVLDEDHYGRGEVKERVLEYLAVAKLKPDRQGTLLCFVGAPGVGKTSFGRSIARATERVFHRISLGGVHDEAEIRGHRRTYVGSLPGRLIRALRTVNVNNPIFMLDEVDKLNVGFQGDPAAALLEALDSEQNHSFVDSYLGVPFDLSRIMFICTANTVATIPSALLDRLEVIRLSGYSIEEKTGIARRHLLPKQLAQAGLAAEAVELPDEVIELLAERYTRESGVRELERCIASLCRKVARDVAGGKADRIVLDVPAAGRLLGPPPHAAADADRPARPGLCATLALRAGGAELVLVDVQKAQGKGKLSVTGRVGDVLRESAVLAYDFVRCSADKFGLSGDEIARFDYHLHFSGAGGPTDGASVGLAIFAALLSVMRGEVLPADCAVIGELTLAGRVLEARDVVEKTAAARRAGIRMLVLPERDRKDLARRRPDAAPEGIELRYCNSVRDAVDALMPAAKRRGAATRTPSTRSR